MKFLQKLMQGIVMLPYIIQGVEQIFGKGNGKPKQEKALDLFNLSVGITEAIAQKDIVDESKFNEGVRELNDSVVKILNASIWHKSNAQ
jgi:hypothetical protein